MRLAVVIGFAALLLGTLHGCPQPPPPGPSAVTIIGLLPLAVGLTSPVGLVQPDDGTGRIFIVDQSGRIFIVTAAGVLLPAPFLDLRDRMVALRQNFDERGLLSLAFHPDFASNGRFFVFYTAPQDVTDPVDFDSENHVSEFALLAGDPNVGDPNSERLLLEIDKPQFNHNGGQLAFGPDGYLYIAVGDGGGANDRGLGHTPQIGNAQDISNLYGSILRIDVDGALPYAIPADNPFVGNTAARAELWAVGLRNPWRFSFDPGGAQRLFAGDAGQALFEEVDIITAGGNYGWNIREGFACFDPNASASPPADCPAVGPAGGTLLDPILDYPHLDLAGGPAGIAVIGGYVYRGNAIPDLRGEYVFGDFSTGFTAPDGSLFAAREDSNGDWALRELTVADVAGGRLGRFLLGFGQTLDGEVYVLTTQNLGPTGDTGAVFRIVPAP